MRRADEPVWRCAECGRAFAIRNQSHACGTHSLERHFAGKAPVVREIYEAFLAMLQSVGPVIVLPEKTRIAFQVRMSFAQLTPRRDWVNGHFVLARRSDDSLFTRIETISRRNHVHHFRIDDPAELEKLQSYAAEAYAVGWQDHLGSGLITGNGRDGAGFAAGQGARSGAMLTHRDRRGT